MSGAKIRRSRSFSVSFWGKSMGDNLGLQNLTGLPEDRIDIVKLNIHKITSNAVKE